MPNYNSNVDVEVPDTLDNPKHLAIRREYLYAVEGLLDKTKQSDGVHNHAPLMHHNNGSGFTPILLALTIFAFHGDQVDEELQIVKVLLKQGANPNDQHVENGNTPLHLVVTSGKNAVALELLCRNPANPHIANTLGHTALGLVCMRRTSSTTSADKKWYGFAERRMSNKLKDSDYRPPELTAFLLEEEEPLSGKPKAAH